MLTGEPPFVRTTPQAILAAQVTEAPVPVTERRETVPAALAGLVMRCLAKKPADRPQRAEEVLGALEVLATPSGGMTPTETQPVGGSGKRSRRRWALVGGAGVAVALGVVGAWAVWFRGPPLPGPDVREPIVVLPFEVQGGDASLQPLGVQAADRISASIRGASVARVVDYRPGGAGEAFTGGSSRRVVRATGAGTLVTGVIAVRGEALEVQASVVRGSDLQTVWTLGPEHGPVADPTPALDAIQDRVLGAVGWYLGAETDGWRNPGLAQPPPSLEALRLSEAAFEPFTAGRYAEALELWRDAFDGDTTWLYGLWRIGAMYYHLGRWQERDSVLAFMEARRERLLPGEALRLDYVRAWNRSPEEAVRTAQAFYSSEPFYAYAVMWCLVAAHRPAEALRYYALRDTMAAWDRGWQEWDISAALAYHMLGRFEEELAMARSAKSREPRFFDHWAREVTALAALGRTDEIERIITESHGLEDQGAPVRLMNTAASELSLHGRPEDAASFAEQVVARVAQWPDSIRALGGTKDILRNALRILGRHDEVVRIYEEQARMTPSAGLQYRILGMKHRVALGDTVGALALVDSARTQPLTAYMSTAGDTVRLSGATQAAGWYFSAYGTAKWATKGVPLYHAAGILSLLGRKDEAVAMLRAALNNGWRSEPDEPLYWYWAPIKDYPPFQELVKIR
jgi:tetratricopeptide (TPR) repeat protein